MPVVFAAYETDVIERSWSNGETMREEEKNLTLGCSHPPHTQTHKANAPVVCTHIQQNVVAHLICGNGGSSDEGRDGGLCDHAVGGDAVRRGVEPKRQEEEVKTREKTELIHVIIFTGHSITSKVITSVSVLHQFNRNTNDHTLISYPDFFMRLCTLQCLHLAVFCS